jgi:colanic acid/amylovoran biosynthesis glycosyltransferase
MHSHFAPVAWSYLKLAKRLGIPHIVSFYGYDYESLPFRKPIWRQRYVQLFKDVDLILCEGSHGASILERNGCPSEKIRIMQLGVKADHIPFWKRIKMSGELHLLQVAAFTEKKGHQYTIDAFLETKRDCPNMTLTLVGNNKQFIKSSLQKYVNKSQFGDKIQFLDAIDFCHLHEFMKNYHVFIHPSCYGENRDCEGGAPIVFLDAQATGMPVIATTHCDIPDEVIHEKTGLLSPEKDTQSLAASIRRFYFMSQVEYDGFSRKARRHVEENYDVTKKGQELRNLYEGILKKKPGF